MDRIYKYNPNVFYKPHDGRYLQLISAKDLYIQNIIVSEHDNHSDSFQVKFPNVVTNYPLGWCSEKLRIKDLLIGIIISSSYGKRNWILLSSVLVVLVV